MHSSLAQPNEGSDYKIIRYSNMALYREDSNLTTWMLTGVFATCFITLASLRNLAGVYKTFFMLNSAEHEIFSANKYENANNSREISILTYVRQERIWNYQ